MINVVKVGAWDMAAAWFSHAPLAMHAAMERGVAEEAKVLAGVARRIITNQGEKNPFKPLALLTLLDRRFSGFRGKKALARRGDLRRAITTHPMRIGGYMGSVWFVGILRTARGSDGQGLMNVGRIHEFGAGPYAVKATEKSWRRLMMIIRKAGLAVGRRLGRNAGPASRVFIITIPARPFLGPAFDERFPGFHARMAARVARAATGYGGGRSR